GVEFARETRAQDRIDYCNPTVLTCRTSLFYPTNQGANGDREIDVAPNFSKTKTEAAYAVDQIKVNKYLEFLGSLRFDRFEQQYIDLAQTTTAAKYQDRTDNMWSYRFGVVLHPSDNSSVYVAYGNSYNPAAELGTFAAGASATAPEQT